MTENLNLTLCNISPIDGRYAEKVESLRPILSEFGLMHYRVYVEIRWLQCLASLNTIPELAPISEKSNKILEKIITDFSYEDAEHIKKIESKTNHDMKAVEYFIKEKIQHHPELAKISEFIHFGCTSEDINNLAYGLMLKTARQQSLLNYMDEIIKELSSLAHEFARVPMLSRTHGQPATPTTMGKEIAVFVARLNRERELFLSSAIYGKFNGAVGNFNAHVIAYPDIDWLKVSYEFVKSLGLEWNAYTTQIESHDYIAGYCHALMRFNNILIDLNRDFWSYISLDYFKQKTVSTEVGSSTMPHKVNPIDFENSEGNLSLANALLNFFATRLPISRFQRDLVDSTILRNLGVAIAHSIIAYQSLIRGLNKCEINKDKIKDDLNNHWEVLTEAAQTVMRAHNIENPYEKLKEFSRGKQIDAKSLKKFIESLDLPEAVKQRLLELTPENYLGLAVKLAEEI